MAVTLYCRKYAGKKKEGIPVVLSECELQVWGEQG